MANKPETVGVMRAIQRGIALRVRVTPRSSIDELSGIVDTAEGPAISARVRAAPTDGEANASVCILLARSLGLSRSSTSISAGHKSRIKMVTVDGDSAHLIERVQRYLADLSVDGGQQARSRKPKLNKN